MSELSPITLAIHQWIRDDAPVSMKMTITPALVSALAARLMAAPAEGAKTPPTEYADLVAALRSRAGAARDGSMSETAKLCAAAADALCATPPHDGSRSADGVCRWLASAWFYGGFRPETIAEREQERFMREAGWWPVKDELDLLARVEAWEDAARAEGPAPEREPVAWRMMPLFSSNGTRLREVDREWSYYNQEPWSGPAADRSKMIIEPLYALPAPVSAPLDREGVAWAWLAANIGMELSWGDADDAEEGEPCVWRVHRCSGGRNDREWDLIATGATPLEAVTQALALSQQDQVGLTTPAVLGEPSADGWIEWTGGENPVSGKVVEALFRDSTIGRAYAHHLFWSHTGKVTDVIAYRVVSPPPPAGGVK